MKAAAVWSTRVSLSPWLRSSAKFLRTTEQAHFGGQHVARGVAGHFRVGRVLQADDVLVGENLPAKRGALVLAQPAVGQRLVEFARREGRRSLREVAAREVLRINRASDSVPLFLWCCSWSERERDPDAAMQDGAERAAAGRAGEVEIERKIVRHLAFETPAKLAPRVVAVRCRRSADAGHCGRKPCVLGERIGRRSRQA